MVEDGSEEEPRDLREASRDGRIDGDESVELMVNRVVGIDTA